MSIGRFLSNSHQQQMQSSAATVEAAEPTRLRNALWILATLLCVSLAGCASKAYRPAALDAQPFLARSVTQSEEDVSVTVAVPDAAETRLLTGLDLEDQAIQPIWLQVTNSGSDAFRLTHMCHEGVRVWIGQISRDLGIRFTKRTITTHKIDPDVDEIEFVDLAGDIPRP